MAKKPNDVEEQVLAFLCGDSCPWTWGGDTHTDRITFNRNGTGELSCGENQHEWLAVEFTWSLFTSPPIVAPDTTNSGTWTLTFVLEMTLTTRLTSIYHPRSPWLKDTALKDHLLNPPSPSKAPFAWAPLHTAAFRPKQYSLRLSRGRFIEPFHLFIKKPYPIFQPVPYCFAPRRYRWRLVFDVSPYPPREEWAVQNGSVGLKGSLEYQRCWEKRTFVRGDVARGDETWGEKFDVGWWFGGSVGDLHTRG